MKGQSNEFILKNGLQRVLRRNMTDAERLLWQRLRHAQLGGHRFRRQHPFEDYILDFVCLGRLVVVEIDGSQHQDSSKDVDRDKRLTSAGFKVLRFWNNQITDEIDAVVECIWNALETHPHPNLPLEGEGTEGEGTEGEGIEGKGIGGEGTGGEGTAIPPLQGEGQGGDGSCDERRNRC